MRTAMRLAIIWLFCFVLFISLSYVMYHIDIQIGEAAVMTGVSAQVNPFLVKIVSWFQIIFGIVSLGLGAGVILAFYFGDQPEYPGEWRG